MYHRLSFRNDLSIKFLVDISQTQLMPWIGSSLTCDSSFISQEIPRILRNYKIHYPVQELLTTIPFAEPHEFSPPYKLG
jgi:hypothetical protein